MKTHIKSGDTVKVIAGDSKGKTGLVKSIDREKNRAIVEGLNLVTKHVKVSAQDPQAQGRVQIEAPIHLSNLALVDPATGEATRIGRRLNDKGKLQRFSKKTNKFI